MNRMSIITLMLATLLAGYVQADAAVCKSVKRKADNVIETFYDGASIETPADELISHLTSEENKCDSSFLVLRLELILAYQSYFDGSSVESSFAKIHPKWKKYLSNNYFRLKSISELMGFVEYLNSIRFVFKHIEGADSVKMKEALINEQTSIANYVLQHNRHQTLRWGLHNQYLN